MQIRELLEKIASCGHMRHGAKEDQNVKSDESALEAEVEQPKKDPKVTFIISFDLLELSSCKTTHHIISNAVMYIQQPDALQTLFAKN